MVLSGTLRYCTATGTFTLPCNKASHFCHVAYSGFAISPRKQQILVRLECCASVIDKNSLNTKTISEKQEKNCSTISANNDTNLKLNRKDFSLNRSYCCSNDITRGGRRPRRPRRSLSVKGNAVSWEKSYTYYPNYEEKKFSIKVKTNSSSRRNFLVYKQTNGFWNNWSETCFSFTSISS